MEVASPLALITTKGASWPRNWTPGAVPNLLVQRGRVAGGFR